MRIVCQKCSAAYAIDDKFVTPKGVRAQCPRCRHLQLVKREAEGQAVPTETQPAASPGGPAGAPNPFESASANDLFDLASPLSKTSPGTAAPPAQTEQAEPRELMDFSELGIPPAAPPPGPQSALPPLPFTSAPASGAAASPFGSFGDNLFGSAGSQAALAPLASASQVTAPVPAAYPPFGSNNDPTADSTKVGPPEAKCKSCGKAIFDPFDQALEICDDCRNKPEQAAPPLDTASSAGASVSIPLNRSAGGASKTSGPTSTRSGLTPPRPYQMQTGMRSQEPAGRKNVVVIGAVVLVVGLVGALVASKRPWIRKPPPLAKRIDGPSAPIEEMVGEWRLRYPELTGTAAEYVEAGDEQMARDTTQGYVRAEEAYQKALVLDSHNDRAVAGWALALAFGRIGDIDERTGKAAEAMLNSAERRSNDPRAYISHAHLLLARGSNFNDVKVLAERGLGSASDKDKALSNLALGQAYLSKNQQFAGEYFEKAAKLDPKLKRAVLYQAQLLVQLGELKKAIDIIEKKLTADPDQWEAADILARLYIEAGELARAKKTYQLVRASSGHDPRVQMTLAILAYQHDGQPAAAIKGLEAVLAEEETLDASDVATALGHLAAAKRISGDLDGANAAATRALDKRPGDLNALVQRFLISVARGKGGDARAQLQPLTGRLGDPGLELLFSGLVELLEGRAPEAQKLFVKAYETDKRRTDALLLAGAAAARAHLDVKAWEYALKLGLAADPWRGGPFAVMAPVFVRSADLLLPVRGAFSPLSHDEEDPNPPLAEALIAWFSDDLDGADKLFDKVVHFDPNNGPGYSFRSFIALKKGHAADAEKLAGRAVNVARAQPLCHLALGLSLLAQNKLEPAKKSLARAAELAPTMLLPKAKVGEIDGRQKHVDDARKALTSVLLSDPMYHEARRAQYLGGS